MFVLSALVDPTYAARIGNHCSEKAQGSQVWWYSDPSPLVLLLLKQCTVFPLPEISIQALFSTKSRGHIIDHENGLGHKIWLNLWTLSL